MLFILVFIRLFSSGSKITNRSLLHISTRALIQLKKKKKTSYSCTRTKFTRSCRRSCRRIVRKGFGVFSRGNVGEKSTLRTCVQYAPHRSSPGRRAFRDICCGSTSLVRVYFYAHRHVLGHRFRAFELQGTARMRFSDETVSVRGTAETGRESDRGVIVVSGRAT